MKTVLCYGDSNTWGHPPVPDLSQPLPRYSIHDRWPGVLRDQLGGGYHVIEEGLSGRCTVYDDPVEGHHKNGRTYLLPCLETAQPVDLVVMMLGTNDLKARFSAPVFDIVWGISQLADMVLNSTFGPNWSAPKLLLISPPPLGKLTFFADLLQGGQPKSREMAAGIRAAAEARKCGFLDAGEHIQTSEADGVHFSVESHHVLGKAVADKVREMLG